MKITEENTKSLLDISLAYNMSLSNLRFRCRKLGIKPTVFNGAYTYRLKEKEVNSVVELFKRKEDLLPQIIYVHTTWEIRESKLNFI
jgi:hypothetical protein